MKRFSALCLAVLMALCLAACGSAAGPGSASATPVESAPPDASPAVPDTEPPTVTISKETRRYQSDDGQATVLSCEWNSAAVSVPGSEKAQAAIQADLDQIAGTFQKTSEEYYREAAALYQQERQNPEVSYYTSYYHALGITTARCDSAIISLVLDEANYTGGAHGFDYRYARNYDAATGQVLTLADLGDGVGDTARDTVVRFVNQIHETDGLFFDRIDAADLKGVVDNDLFYFDRGGVVFISGQYALQSYAEGIVTFTVSYDDLAGKLRDAYNPGGGRTQCDTAFGAYTWREDSSLDTSQVHSDEAATTTGN